MLSRVVGAAMAAAGLSIAACESPFQQREDSLAIAEARWRAAGVLDYSFEYERSCECLPAAVRAVRVLVAGGSHVAVIYLDDGTPADTALFRDALTLDRLFASLHRVLAERPATFTASYDADLGFPRSVAVDYNQTTADDETFFQVSSLQIGVRTALRR